MAIGYNTYGARAQGEEDSSERKYRLLFTSIEVYSTILCHFNPVRRLQLYEAFATYRLHLLELLISNTLASVILYHHVFIGRALAYGQDDPDNWAIPVGGRYQNILKPRPEPGAHTASTKPARAPSIQKTDQPCWNWNEGTLAYDTPKSIYPFFSRTLGNGSRKQQRHHAFNAFKQQL